MLLKIEKKKRRNIKGRINYLIYGNKGSQRNSDRAKKDRRIQISGNLIQLGHFVELIKAKKKWKQAFKNMLISFSKADQEKLMAMPESERIEAMNKMTREFIQRYCPNDNIDDLMFHSEAHQPKIKHEIDEETGEKKERLLHIHITLALMNVKTGKQVRLLPFNKAVDRSINTHMCLKYGMDVPSDFIKKETKKRYTSKVDIARNKVVELVKNGEWQNIRELEKLLDSNSEILEVNRNKKGAMSVKIKADNKRGYSRINLAGSGFEELELAVNELNGARPTVSQAAVYAIRKGKLTRALYENIRHDPEVRKELVTGWTNRTQKNKYVPKNEQLANDTMFLPALDQYLHELSISQRRFFAVYRANVDKTTAADIKIFDDKERQCKRIYSKRLKAVVVDSNDKITLNAAKGSDIHSQMRLMVACAISKGWLLDEIKAIEPASEEFKAALEREKERLRSEESIKEKANEEMSQCNVTDVAQPKLSPVKYMATQSASEEFKKEARKKLIREIKDDLPMENILQLAKHKGIDISGFTLGVGGDYRHVIESSTGRKYNAIDFLNKVVGMPIKEALHVAEIELNTHKAKQLVGEIPVQVAKPQTQKQNIARAALAGRKSTVNKHQTQPNKPIRPRK